MKNENKIGTDKVEEEIADVEVTRSIQELSVTTESGEVYIVNYIHSHDSDEYAFEVRDYPSKDIEFAVRVAALVHLHQLYEKGL
jgi:hypothetical protein